MRIRLQGALFLPYAAQFVIFVKNRRHNTWVPTPTRAATALENARGHVTSPRTYDNERSPQSAVGLAYFYATSYYTIVNEHPAGKGYADIAFIPHVPSKPPITSSSK